MFEIEKIFHLTQKINMELQHFVPCVRSEIESKSIIRRHLKEIQLLAKKIQQHEQTYDSSPSFL